MAEVFGKKLDEYTARQYTGDMSQMCDARAVEYRDGRASGVKAYEVYTGSGLTFSVLESRGMDIAQCAYRGKPISHIAKSGVANGTYYEPEGEGWFRTFFAGLLTTCGLSNTCAPCTDGGVSYGMHGRISNIPAENVNVRKYWQRDDYVIELSGEMREAVFYGENLLLTRRIRTKLGSREIEIHDSVRNEGFSSVPLMILYHFNFGFPLIDEKSFLHINPRETQFFDEAAEEGRKEMFRFQKPTHHYFRQVFIHRLEGNDEGQSTCLIESKGNGDIPWGVYLKKYENQLPYLFEFKMMGEGDYQLGIEPANSGPYGRREEKKAGRVRYIEPGETKNFDLLLGVVEGKDGLAGVRETM
jgi:hypothetical protein